MSDIQMILTRLKMKLDSLRLTRLEREELDDYLNLLLSAIQRLVNENDGLKSSLRELEKEVVKKGGG